MADKSQNRERRKPAMTIKERRAEKREKQFQSEQLTPRRKRATPA
ncbi:hypothetical protein [Mycolicibacterium parafortuitum]|uniref:Uncharacterized protein n=1 Tax=Mycolicibacterium parafortuitum TaxID=39692 RepID=A0A375YDD2_MYCPF|nr:hypothetical protein [Mycolicibacterium parafortuitum]SRX79100.1 hypothetical protein MPP7335_00833 [Mycolicibacterium parafortuitum]